jgi:hypothetical protein
MPGAECARSLVCENKKAHKHSHHGHTGNARHSPRNGLAAYIALSPVTGLSCHRRLADTSAKLDASVGASGPHDFAVRGISALVFGAARVHRIPPRVRDDREPPLCEAGRGELVEMICPTGKAEYFSRRGWTDFSRDRPSGKSVGIVCGGSKGRAIRPFLERWITRYGLFVRDPDLTNALFAL